MLVTASMNQKGGVGKTGLTVGVAGALVERGRRVLVADVDPQGHLTVMALQMAKVGFDEPSLAQALAGQFTGSVRQLVVTHTELPNGGRLDVLPTSSRMFTAPRDLDRRADRERQLGRLLEDYADDYDHVLLDPPPSLEILTDSVLAACDGLLIPVQVQDTSIEAIRLMLGHIRVIERELRLDPPLVVHGLVPGLYREPLNLVERSVDEQLASIASLPILARLPFRVGVSEAWRAGVPLVLHAPRHPLADQCRDLADVLDKAAGLPIPPRTTTTPPGTTPPGTTSPTTRTGAGA